MTPARKAALKKAQIASARKRKGTGRAKVSSVRRRKGATKSSGMTRRRKAAIATAAVGAIGAAAGAGYVYKNRERLVIAKRAEAGAIKRAKKNAKAQGKTLSKTEINKVRMQERYDHANRSTYRVREYRAARQKYRSVSKWSKGKLNLRVSGQAGSMYDNAQLNHKGSAVEQWQNFYSYRRDVYTRANQRLSKMRKRGVSATRQGRVGTTLQKRAIQKSKTKGFGYDSGKRLLVNQKGVVKRAFW
jgi:hypothetical protein